MLRSILAFSSVGIFVTLCSVAAFWLLAGPGHLDPNLSLLLVYLVFTIVGHYLHGAFSFRDITDGRGDRQSLWRFSLVSLLGFLLNQTFVYLIVKYLGLPSWAATLPMIFVTPPIVFVLSRYWAFRREMPAESS